MTLTPRQANVMDHAVAYPRMYRNHFVATVGTPNDDTWKELVALGYARMHPDAQQGTDDRYNVYNVTALGMDVLKLFHKG